MAELEKKDRPYNSRQLTKHLREFANDVETMDGDRVITRGEALALLLWKMALGFEAEDPETKTIRHYKPQAWAIQLVYERLEGKTPQALVDDQAHIIIADKVSELVQHRLNQQAEAAVAIPDETGPVDRSSDGSKSSEKSTG